MSSEQNGPRKYGRTAKVMSVPIKDCNVNRKYKFSVGYNISKIIKSEETPLYTPISLLRALIFYKICISHKETLSTLMSNIHREDRNALFTDL